MRVKAAVAWAYGAPLVLDGLDLDEPYADEILVRLVAAGVSLVDRDAIDGKLAMPLPFVPGSEGAGIVERVGEDVTHVAPGDAVIIGYAACGACANCAIGKTRACADFAALNLKGRRSDGSMPFARSAEGSIHTEGVNGFFFGQSSFATHLVCKATSAVKVPADAPLEILAVLGGDLLNGAGAVSRGFRLQSADTILIAGADAAGLVATMVAKARGTSMIIVADPDEARRALASDCGATLAVSLDDDLSEMVRSMVADGVRLALDTIGDAPTRRACFDSLAAGGSYALLRPVSGGGDAADRTEGDRTLLFEAADGPAPEMLLLELMALHGDGRLPIEKLVTFFPFELVNDALDALASGRVVKPVLRFSLGPFGDLDRAKTEGAADEEPEEEPAEDKRPVSEPASDEAEQERQPAAPSVTS